MDHFQATFCSCFVVLFTHREALPNSQVFDTNSRLAFIPTPLTRRRNKWESTKEQTFFTITFPHVGEQSILGSFVRTFFTFVLKIAIEKSFRDGKLIDRLAGQFLYQFRLPRGRPEIQQTSHISPKKLLRCIVVIS